MLKKLGIFAFVLLGLVLLTIYALNAKPRPIKYAGFQEDTIYGELKNFSDMDYLIRFASIEFQPKKILDPLPNEIREKREPSYLVFDVNWDYSSNEQYPQISANLDPVLVKNLETGEVYSTKLQSVPAGYGAFYSEASEPKTRLDLPFGHYSIQISGNVCKNSECHDFKINHEFILEMVEFQKPSLSERFYQIITYT